MVTPSASCTLKSKVPGNWSLVHQVIYDSLPFCRHAVVCSNISCTNRLYWEHTESTAEQPSSFSFYVVKKQLAAISSRPHPQVFMTKETTECFLAIFQACAGSASFEMFCHGMNRRCLHDTRSVNSVLNTVFTHSTGNSDVCVLIFVNEQERTCATTDTANTCQMMNNSTLFGNYMNLCIRSIVLQRKTKNLPVHLWNFAMLRLRLRQSQISAHRLHSSYHVFEGVLHGSNHQALMWNFLLRKEARGWGARWTRSPCGAPERGGPGKGALWRRSEVVIYGFLAKAGGWQQGWCAQDFHHLLKVQSNVVMKKAWGHYSCPRAGVSIKQRPVVEGQVVRAFLQAERRQTASFSSATEEASWWSVQHVGGVPPKGHKPRLGRHCAHCLLSLSDAITAQRWRLWTLNSDWFHSRCSWGMLSEGRFFDIFWSQSSEWMNLV